MILLIICMNTSLIQHNNNDEYYKSQRLFKRNLTSLRPSRGIPWLVGLGVSGPSPISLQPMRAATVAGRGSAVLSVATEDDEAVEDASTVTVTVLVMSGIPKVSGMAGCVIGCSKKTMIRRIYFPGVLK